MARVNVQFGDITVQNKLVAEVANRLTIRLLPELRNICEWYRDEVASFRYVYFDGYPRVNEKLRDIILQANEMNDNLNVDIVIVGNRIRFHIKVFDDSEGGYLDKMTQTENSNLGWWRFFEEGVPGQRNFGSTRYGFIPTGKNQGFMVPAYSINGKKPKPHPGVFKVGVFEATWDALKNEFMNRVRAAIKKAVLNI